MKVIVLRRMNPVELRRREHQRRNFDDVVEDLLETIDQ